ncbi:MAG: hypothetical protein ACXVCT_22550, partial [Ktedonobacterales bacterium]
MNQEPESFRPVSSVQDILEGLQEQSMGWMAEEIADHIREGRALSEDATLFGVKRRSTTPSHMTIPFSAEDQMRIALMTVVRYVVETYDTWNLAIQGLRDILVHRSSKAIHETAPKRAVCWRWTSPD